MTRYPSAPVLTYGAETLKLTKASARNVRMAQRKMERPMLGVSLRDKIKTRKKKKEIRRRTKDIIETISKSK